MARATAAKPSSQALTKWEQEMAEEAAKTAQQERKVGGGKYFSVKGSTLKYDDAPVTGNHVAAIVVDSIIEQIYYENDYDPEVKQSPDCYAFSHDPDTIAPKDDVPNKQADTCAECPHFKWGSGKRGKGKACREQRKLAIVAAGLLDDNGDLEPFDVEDLKKGDMATMKVSTTSVKNWAGYVKQLSSALKRPTRAVVTRIAVQPHEKNQYEMIFEPIGKLEQEKVMAMNERYNEAEELLERPYAEVTEEEKPAPRRAKPAKGRRY